jgi:hypothetical protein
MKHALGRLFFALAAVFAVIFMSSSVAFAGDNDIDLRNLCINGDCGNGKAAFGKLAKSYAAVMSPMHFQPAGTLGEEGFEMAAEGKFSFPLKKNEGWWGNRKVANKNNLNTSVQNNALTEVDGPDYMAGIQLHMRKGLPFSFEVEGEFNWLAGSELFYVGAGLRWAVLDGFWYLPDLSVRANVGGILGSSDISLINVNMDVELSYTWGLGGICSITPMAGYTLLTSFASSHPIVLTTDQGEPFESVFRRQTLYQHAVFGGIQLQGDFFVFGVEVDYNITSSIVTTGVKIGTDF